MYNPNFWKTRFLNDFIPSVRRVEETFLNRLMPTFSAIYAESEEYAERLWKDAMSQPYYGEGYDEADIAEAIHDAQISHYLGLQGMEQGLLNCCALFLYHLYEQQLMVFLRQELLDWRIKDNLNLFNHKEFKNRLMLAGVDVHKFSVWPKLEELRCLANTIKHGEGKSSQELLSIAPHLFSLPEIMSRSSRGMAISGRVYTPIIGDDICVNGHNINEYADAIDGFWLELASKLGAI